MRSSLKPLLDPGILYLIGVALICCPRWLSEGELSPLLYGDDIFVSLGTLLVGCVPVWLLSNWLRHKGLDKLSVGFFALAALVSYHYIHISSNTAYTNDIRDHLSRIYFTMGNWSSPYSFSGWQDHHPLGFYYIAALVTSVARLSQAIPELTMIRYFSWLCFLVFNAYNLRTLARSGLSGVIYRVCAALLMLWPLGLHAASKISPEPVYYALYSSSFFYALRWYQMGALNDIRRALILAGVAFTIRTNAVILFAILGIMLLVALRRGRVPVKRYFVFWCGISVWLLACAGLNFSRVMAGKSSLVNMVPEKVGITEAHFFHYDLAYVTSHPFVSWTKKQGFIDHVMKTSIFGEYHWSSPQFAMVIGGLLIPIVLYALLPWCCSRRHERRGLLPYAASMVVSITFLVAFTLYTDLFAAQDARYIYPALPCFVILFGKSYESLRAKGAVVVAQVGPLLSVPFVLLSVIFFWFNAR